MIESMLTTIDNPYNPFDSFDSWNAWDMRAGHNTLSYLARVLGPQGDVPPIFEIDANENAINAIVEENLSGLYLKVTKETGVPDEMAHSEEMDDVGNVKTVETVESAVAEPVEMVNFTETGKIEEDDEDE